MSGQLDATALAVTSRLLTAYGTTGSVQMRDSGGAVLTTETCLATQDVSGRGWGARSPDVLGGDEFYYVDAASLSRMPVLGDRITINGTLFDVIGSRRVQPGVAPVVYLLHVRA